MRIRWMLLALLASCVPARAADAPPLMQQLSNELAALADQALPSVVRISAGNVPELPPPAPNLGQANPLRNIMRFRLGRSQPAGFVCADDGTIATLGDFRADAKVKITYHDGRVAEGTVVGRDAETGLAAIRPDGNAAPPRALRMSDAAGARAGALVLALVSANGAAPAPFLATLGSLEADAVNGRNGPFLRVAGVPMGGAAGGPVLDARGEVVGILAGGAGAAAQSIAIAEVNGRHSVLNSQDGLGIGHALPAQAARRVIEQLRAGKAVKRGFLGVSLGELTPELAQRAGVAPGAGVFVQDVTGGGPAANAGVKAEDVITAIDGKAVKTPVEVSVAIRAIEPGKAALVGISRKGQNLEIPVILGEAPEPPRAAAAPGFFQVQPLEGGGNIRVNPFGGVFAAPAFPGAAGPDKMATVDFQAAGLAEAIVQALNGTGIGFRVAPELLADAALATKPFGLKSTNTPIAQVLDQLAAHYGIRCRFEGGVAVFEKK